eukprot:scaffold233584_cov17-Tisochrysis_lutea.AAC.1
MLLKGGRVARGTCTGMAITGDIAYVTNFPQAPMKLPAHEGLQNQSGKVAGGWQAGMAPAGALATTSNEGAAGKFIPFEYQAWLGLM